MLPGYGVVGVGEDLVPVVVEVERVHFAWNQFQVVTGTLRKLGYTTEHSQKYLHRHYKQKHTFTDYLMVITVVAL